MALRKRQSSIDYWQAPDLAPLWRYRVAGGEHHQQELQKARSASDSAFVTAELHVVESGQYQGAINVSLLGQKVGSLSRDRDEEIDLAVKRMWKQSGPVKVRGIIHTSGGGQDFTLDVIASDEPFDAAKHWIAGSRRLQLNGLNSEDVAPLPNDKELPALVYTVDGIVWVQLNGGPIGKLSAVSNDEYLDALSAYAHHGTPATATARVKKSRSSKPSVTVCLLDDPQLLAELDGAVPPAVPNQGVSELQASAGGFLNQLSAKVSDTANKVAASDQFQQLKGTVQSTVNDAVESIKSPSSSGSPQPDWYPDPHGRHEYRYWDGTTWTDHVSNGGIQQVDLL